MLQSHPGYKKARQLALFVRMVYTSTHCKRSVQIFDETPDTRSTMPRNVARTGRVKWFNASKGFGYISPADGSKEVFVHVKDVQVCRSPRSMFSADGYRRDRGSRTDATCSSTFLRTEVKVWLRSMFETCEERCHVHPPLV